MILLITMVLSIILNIFFGYALFNLTRKTELYEDFIERMLDEIDHVTSQMRAVDIRGSFEADDEVGIVFKGLLGMTLALEGFLNQEQ